MSNLTKPVFSVTLTRAQTRAMGHAEALYADGLLALAAASANKNLAAIAAPVARREGFRALFDKATAAAPANFSGVARWLNAELDAMPSDAWHCLGKQASVYAHAATLAAWAEGRYDKTQRTEKVLEIRARKVESVRFALDLIEEYRTVQVAIRAAELEPPITA